MIAAIKIIRPADLLSLAEEPLRHRPARRIPFLTQLRRPPNEPGIGSHTPVILLHDPRTPRQPIIRKLAHVGSVRDPDEPIRCIPGILVCGGRGNRADEIPVEIVAERLRDRTVRHHDLIIIRRRIVAVIRRLHRNDVRPQRNLRIRNKRSILNPHAGRIRPHEHRSWFAQTPGKPDWPTCDRVRQLVQIVMVRLSHTQIDLLAGAVPSFVVPIFSSVYCRARLQPAAFQP
jgi:hypothetical protein